MTASLLPQNSSRLERNIEKVIRRSSSINASFGDLWNPLTCPSKALPWLAWAVGVKEWSMSWPEPRQRQVIASAMGIRKTAGTVASIRKAIESLDIEDINYSEWHQHGGLPGTYRITATLEERGMTQAQYDELVRVIRTAGRLSAWMDPAGFTVVGRAKSSRGLTSGSGSLITLMPLRRSMLQCSCAVISRAVIRAAVVLSVYPPLAFKLQATTQQDRLTTTQAISWATIYPIGD